MADDAKTRLIEALIHQLGPVWHDGKLTPMNLVHLIEEDRLLIEIMINPSGSVWIERAGAGAMECIGEKHAWEIEAVLGLCATSMGREINRETPLVEGELPIGGCRIEGMLPPLVSGPTLTIRVPAKFVYSLEEYVRAGSMSDFQAAFMRDAVRAGLNILIAGGTQSGKTTLANALIKEIPNEQRLVLIEDTLELQCRNSNLVQMHTSLEYDLRKLVRATMRMRPDRIIIGEVRGGEALDLLKAWNTGHPGGITTMHANDCRSALWKMDALVQEAGVGSQRELIGDAIQLVVFIEKTPSGRRIREMQLLKGYNGADFNLTPVCEETTV